MSTEAPARQRGASLPGRIAWTAAMAVLVSTALSSHLGILRTLRVSSINMVPTLSPDERVLVQNYGGRPARGDVVVYRPPFGESLMVGRVVALAGEEVELSERGLELGGKPATTAAATACQAAGVTPDASRPIPACSFDPTLIAAETLGSHHYFTRTAGGLSTLLFPARLVPEDHVFVLNDNRIDERDSRIYGAIPVDAVVGVASFVYYASDETGIRWDRMNRRVS